jgi:DNA polymerase-3 subunit delta'
VSAPQLVAPLGQGAALQRLLRAARSLRLHHAVLVVGPPGSGASTVARWLAAALLCPNDLAVDAPCGACRTCRRVHTSEHPDLHTLRIEAGRHEVAIGQVRDLQRALLLSAVEARARVAIVDPADSLNEEGQNALLKTLEEPGDDTFVLLCASAPEALLPTVRSRCERLGVRRLDDATVRAELSRRAPERAAAHERAIALARGCLGQALLACTEQAVQLQDLVQQACATSKPLRPLATARAVLAGAENGADAAARARAFVAAVRTEGALRLRALATAPGASYPAAASRAWTGLLTSALAAEQDLDLQIPPLQVLIGLLVQWSRDRSGGSG